MKRVLIFAAVILSAICLAGCFKITTISFTEKTRIDSGLQANSNISDSKQSGWTFYAGKIDYTSKNKNYRDSSKKSVGSNENFSTVQQFYNYIVNIKDESDKTIEFLEIPGYTKQEIESAISKNSEILYRVKHIEIPEDIFKTNDGKFFAKNFVADHLETILNFRIDLLKKKSKALVRMTNSLKWDIDKLENAIIPNKVAAFNYTGQSMMEEEGYILNEKTNNFEKKK